MKNLCIILITLLAGFILIGCMEEQSSTAPTPEQIEAAKQRKAERENQVIPDEQLTPEQYGPHQKPKCENDIEVALKIPKYYFFLFEYEKLKNGETWEWAKTIEKNKGEHLINWLSEDESNIFIVGNATRKEFLQQEYPWFKDQIKMLTDLHPNLPSRNYKYIAVDDQWDLVESIPLWFYGLFVELNRDK